MAVGYIRVSTKEQDEESQRQAIAAFIENRAIPIERFFVDKGESGSKPFMTRPQAQELWKLFETHPDKRMVVFAIDRLGRDMMDMLDTLQRFERAGIMILSVREEWMQTTDPNFRRLIFAIFSWIAEFEKRRMRERQEAAWAIGKQKGRPKIALPMDEIKRRMNAGWTRRAIWRWLAMDKELKISYSALTTKIKEGTSG